MKFSRDGVDRQPNQIPRSPGSIIALAHIEGRAMTKAMTRWTNGRRIEAKNYGIACIEIPLGYLDADEFTRDAGYKQARPTFSIGDFNFQIDPWPDGRIYMENIKGGGTQLSAARERELSAIIARWFRRWA